MGPVSSPRGQAIPLSSEQTAWKHAPGAIAAEGRVKAVVLSPGDTVLFKAGVVYRGSVEIPASGKEGAPIV